jgi:molybdate transport system substrate-binding protein
VTRCRRAAALATAALLTTALVACGADDGDDAVVVFAASSLTDVLDDMAAGPLADGPPIEVVAAGSQTLVAQLADGADADLLLTADRATMERAVAEGSVAGEPSVIATNALVVAVAPGNPAGITSVGDLADADNTIGVCAAAVPCGALAVDAATGLDIDLAADTEEPNVRALATKIALGEIDAGLVYATEAAALDLETVGAAELGPWRTEYLAATVPAEPPAAVTAVLTAVIGDEGAAVLAVAGFSAPNETTP